jgi:hypothetical protein
VTGFINLIYLSISGAIARAVRSVFLMAIILGRTSQNIRMNPVEATVARITPILGPVKCTNIAETITEKDIFVKLFPISIPTMNLSEWVIRYWTFVEWRAFWAIRWRSLILLIAIIAVSESEKKNDTAEKKSSKAKRDRGYIKFIAV